MKNIKKILIFQTAFVGDVVLITAMIRETKITFPNAAIDVLIIPSTANILSNNPHINKLIIYDKKKKTLSLFLSTILNLRKEKYDLVLSPHHSLRTGIMLFLSGIKNRVGFGKWTARHFFNIKVEHFRGVHKLYKLLNLLSPFTKRELSIQTELFPSAQDIDFADKFIKPDNINILIAPGSVWKTKCWPSDYYISLINGLLKHNIHVILSGSPSEKELCDHIIQNINPVLKDNITSTAGITNLIKTAALASKCRLVICNDSGTLHIANAMKIPVFAFFGPTLQRFGYFPYQKDDFVFETELDCRPCGTHGHNVCPLGHHNCMKNISPDSVITKTLAFLGI